MHADEAGGEVDALQRVAGVLQAAEQERDEQDGERVVARERRDHDPGVAEPGGRQSARVEHVPEVAVLATRRRCPRPRPRAPSRRGSSAACACRRSVAARGESPITCTSKPNRVRV